MIYVGKLRTISETSSAFRITVQGPSLNGRDDRTEYLPKSVVHIKKDRFGEILIFVPDWILNKKNINWNRINEIEPILDFVRSEKTWNR